jgi:signal transduction histidine kinase
LDSGNVKIDYMDDGCGIPKENLSRVYEPFFTTKKDEGGSGLGLQIVYHLVTQELKGKIFVESTEGEGVHFSIVLPKGLD